MKSYYKGGQWDKQFKDITALLKKSIAATNQYSRHIFDNEQQFLRKFSQEYIANLRNIKAFKTMLPSECFYNQLGEKLKALTSLFFPEMKISESMPQQLKFKHKRIERILRIAQQEQTSINVNIGSDLIRSLLQEESKLNMEPELFIFKCFFISQHSDLELYRPSNPAVTLQKESFPQQTTLSINIIHGYFQEEAANIILSNLPTLGSYKTVFHKAIENKDISELATKGQSGKAMGEDNDLNSNTCFNYFGHAMQFDFFNSLLQPLTLSNYIRRLSIIEDRAICQGLILGAIDSIPSGEEPDLSDSDKEEEWEQQVEKVAQDFCSFFEGYFEEEEASGEVKVVATKIAILRNQKYESVTSIIRRYWCK